MTPSSTHARATACRQRGAVLFVSLIFLLVLTLLGVMLARTQTTEERMAANDANRDIALEAAGATLRFAEMNISQGNYSAFSQNTAGLYTLDPAVGDVYSPAIWNSANGVLTYTGTPLASVSAAPEFIVEQLPSVALPGNSLGACQQGYGANGCVQVFEITAHASGGDRSGNATLRSIYEKE
jgi:type IV pilus assembly protein PilX